jgi:hypothetical protein
MSARVLLELYEELEGSWEQMSMVDPVRRLITSLDDAPLGHCRGGRTFSLPHIINLPPPLSNLYVYKGIKCKFEFCWACLANYDDIRLYGNSKHTKACEYHTDNLPSLPPGIT